MRMIEGNQKQWHNKLDFALWPYKISIKSSIKTSPCALVYGKHSVLPIHLELPALQILHELRNLKLEPLQIWMNQLLSVEEQNKAYDSLWNRQDIVKRWFN